MSLARCSGPATKRHHSAPPSCTSTASCAARASSSSPNISRPTSAPARASRYCSRPGASSASTMSARRPAVPATLCGTRKTGSKFTPSARRRTARHPRRRLGTGFASRAGETTLRVQITERVAPGVIYTTFHHPETQANVVTTEYTDWATNCPEYKVTAVQVSPSNGPTEWQEQYEELSRRSRRVSAVVEAAE